MVVGPYAAAANPRGTVLLIGQEGNVPVMLRCAVGRTAGILPVTPHQLSRNGGYRSVINNAA